MTQNCRTVIHRLILLASLLLAMNHSLAQETDDKSDAPLPLEGKTEKLEFSTTEGSWLSIDVTPDGETLVFDLLGDLYTLPISGGNATRITSGLGFDSQPVVSPDGKWIAFVSDRSGSNNLWIAKVDGSEPRKISAEKQWGIISPAWTPDSKYVVVTRTAVTTELTMYHIDGGNGVTLSGPTADEKFWGIGATISPDAEFVYFAQGVDSNGPVTNFPATQIVRFNLENGAIDQVTRGEGGGVRPVLSPDGTQLVYGTRMEARTGLRIRELRTGADRWLSYPVQRDAQENYRPPSRDLLPGYSFTPDGQSVVYNSDGKIWRVAIASGEKTEIPFVVDVSLDVGPDLTAAYRVPQGDLTATLIHDPFVSPDGETIAASVLGNIYTSEIGSNDAPGRLTSTDNWEFKPVYSPDGRWITFVTWSMNDAGHIWRARSNGSGRPQQLTDIAAFYTEITYAPDGESIVAMRGNEYMRHQTMGEFTGLGIPLEMIILPADGGTPTVVATPNGARNPHFGADHERVYMHDDKGLFSIQLDGSDRREELIVTGPRGNRRGEEPPNAESIRISSDGKYALALVNKQVWVIAISRSGGVAPKVDVRKPALPAVRLTDIGADFFGWANDGDTIWWAIGNTYLQRDLNSISFHKEEPENGEEEQEDAVDVAFVPEDEHESVRRTNFSVVAKRNTPSGSMVLRGANVIAMSGDTTDEMKSVLNNQDIVITDNRIVSVGTTGTVEIPEGAEIVDVTGKYVLPGFIDTHAHWEFRTGDVLEPQNWSLTTNLAYGVTSGLDVQTSYKDYLTYRDFVETGQSVGQRAFMTARGVFGNNDFQSYNATLSYLRRYKDHYRTANIKSYVVGNRKQRQWIVLASQELGLMPTTEGAGDQKLNLTHAIDGMHGNEHTLPDSPLFRDVVELFAQTRTAYTPALVVQYNAERLREYFFSRTEVHDDPKLRRFYPHNRLDELTQRRPGWQRDSEFQFREAAAQAAKIQRAGGLVGVGGHAELQGLGYHWEMWAYEMGGMETVEVLRAATIDGARIVGIDQDLGSIEAGKLADMVILDANPLENIRNTTAIDRVLQNGRLYDGDTLDQIWPDQVPLTPFWWWSEDDPRFSPSSLAQ